MLVGEILLARVLHPEGVKVIGEVVIQNDPLLVLDEVEGIMEIQRGIRTWIEMDVYHLLDVTVVMIRRRLHRAEVEVAEVGVTGVHARARVRRHHHHPGDAKYYNVVYLMFSIHCSC